MAGCCANAYYGCATCGNKFVWGTFLFSLILGAALLAAGIVQGKDCIGVYQDCQKDNSHSFCRTFANDQCNFDTYIALICLGAIMVGLICPVLCLWFNCCARAPRGPQEEELYPAMSFNSSKNSSKHNSSSRPPMASAYPSGRNQVV